MVQVGSTVVVQRSVEKRWLNGVVHHPLSHSLTHTRALIRAGERARARKRRVFAERVSLLGGKMGACVCARCAAVLVDTTEYRFHAQAQAAVARVVSGWCCHDTITTTTTITTGELEAPDKGNGCSC